MEIFFYIESFLNLLGIDYYYEYGIKLFKYRFFHDRYDYIVLDLNVFFGIFIFFLLEFLGIYILCWVHLHFLCLRL